MPARFQLPPAGALTPNNDADPLPFYYKPVVGRIFVARLDTGLGLVDGRFEKLLEIGYGSGLLMPTLAALTDELYGADLEVEPPGLRDKLSQLGVTPKQLVQADIQDLPFSDGLFDGVVAFSILEHLKPHQLERACREVARVLRPGGRFLVGCPAVHKAMNAAFAAIGFSGIENHHFSSLPEVVHAAGPYFTLEKRASLPRLLDRIPLGWAPYSAVLLRKS
jgi:ubiquinone/menaquinone biosynthesis C-methylase UbiE